MIKAIIFDLWGTLAYKKKSFVSSIIKLFGLQNSIRSQHKIERALMLYRSGTWQKEYAKITHLLGIKGNAKTRAGFKKIIDFEEKPSSRLVYSDVVTNLKLLKKKYRIGLVSNTSDFGVSFLKKKGILNYIDADIRSYEVHLLKPGLKIYRECLRRLRVKPDEAVMVGDTYEHDIEPALKLGMHAVLITRRGFMRSYSKKHKYKYAISNLGRLDLKIKSINKLKN